MKKVSLISILLILLYSNTSIGQTYLEQHKKCSEILKDIKIGDSTFGVNLIKRDSCLIGLKAPFYEVSTIDHEKFNSDSLKGKVLFLNFWFTKCKACIEEMPYLNRLVSKYKKENILFLSFANDDSSKIKQFLKIIKFNFKIVPERGDILLQTFKLFSIWPTSVIIDKEGKIRLINMGLLNDSRDNHLKIINQLLK